MSVMERKRRSHTCFPGSDKFVTSQKSGGHQHEQNLLIIGSGEDTDLPRSGRCGWCATGIMRHRRAGVLELKTWKPCGLMPDIT